jgi:pimeloyl-ACP methyl ester carboxylesterase
MKTFLPFEMNLWRAVSRPLLRFGAVAALVVLAGCSAPIGVQKLSPREAYRNLHQNALNSGQCSQDTLVVLRRYNLEASYQQDPSGTLKQLHNIACTDERRDVLYALSELSYANAERLRRSVKRGEKPQARDNYFTSAIYAYLYLFGESREVPSGPYDLHIREACDFYNRGLALGLIANMNTNAVVELASGPRQTPPGLVEVQFTQPGFHWSMDHVEKFYSADEFAIRGLTTRNRDSGLGAPLIVAGETRDATTALRTPATVFLRVTGDARSWRAGQMTASLELYSTVDATNVQVNGKPVPLQTDTTAPIASALDNSAVWNVGMAQFFSGNLRITTGIRRSQPYSPGRIPVVFVHGTASSPVWWAEMLNTLKADPVLREHYQFWAFNYASGYPVTYTAGILRSNLMAQVKELDPEGKDPALREMVIIGHSQGGLLAKLTATDTGDKLWRLVSDKSIDQLDTDPQTRELLRSNFFFKPLPCVKRVIFIATPHRGSYANSRFVQSVLNRFIELNRDLVSASARLLTLQDQIRLPKSVREGVPTSLSGMTTDNPFMLALADIPVAPGIKCNSIIAIKGDDQPPNGADGAVKYTSAHVDYAESEFIVRSGHSCQGNPLTIEEVRRILIKHLNDLSPDEHPLPISASATPAR